MSTRIRVFAYLGGLLACCKCGRSDMPGIVVEDDELQHSLCRHCLLTFIADVERYGNAMMDTSQHEARLAQLEGVRA